MMLKVVKDIEELDGRTILIARHIDDGDAVGIRTIDGLIAIVIGVAPDYDEGVSTSISTNVVEHRYSLFTNKIITHAEYTSLNDEYDEKRNEAIRHREMQEHQEFLRLKSKFEPVTNPVDMGY